MDEAQSLRIDVHRERGANPSRDRQGADLSEPRQEWSGPHQSRERKLADSVVPKRRNRPVFALALPHAFGYNVPSSL